jgi:hypothetical protein
VTQDEKRLDAVMNLMANATTILTASMSSALGNAVGGAFAGMGEAVGAALGDGEAAHARGDAVRKKVAQEVDAKMRDLVTQAQREIRQAMGETIASLTPAQRKDVLKEIRGEVYGQAIEAANRADFGLPRLTEPLSVDDVLTYFEVQDPRLGELVQKILALPQPRVFAQLQAAEREKLEKKEAKENAKKARSIKAAPARITKLPATVRFAPGAKSEIAIRSTEPLWIKWDAQLQPGERCENYGIGVESGGSGTSTPSGGTVLYPEKGRITATITNKEDFAIVVEVHTEPYES